MAEREVFCKSPKLTADLEFYIEKFNTFDEFEKAFPDDFLNEDNRLGDYIAELLKKHKRNQSIISELAGFDRSYLGNIIRGINKNPKRDVLIKICLAMGCSFAECQKLLKHAGYAPLYVRRKRDVIIWFGFIKNKSIGEIDDDLDKRGFLTLSTK